MNDLVERLRDLAARFGKCHDQFLCEEAAAEIERLRARVAEMLEQNGDGFRAKYLRHHTGTPSMFKAPLEAITKARQQGREELAKQSIEAISDMREKYTATGNKKPLDREIRKFVSAGVAACDEAKRRILALIEKEPK